MHTEFVVRWLDKIKIDSVTQILLSRSSPFATTTVYINTRTPQKKTEC